MVERIGRDARSGRRWTAATVATFGAAWGATVLPVRLCRRPAHPTLEEQGGSLAGRGRPGAKPSVRSREAGYETSDANVRSLVIIMIVAVMLMGGGLASVFLMFARFDRGFRAPDKVLTAVQRAPIDPPLPHLQEDPYRDLNVVLMEQDRRLTSYGWNDPDHTSAHIPIARAMQQVVGKPLDGTAEADAAGAPGSTQAFPSEPAVEALRPQNKPANTVQGEGRADKVAPSYDAEDARR